MASNVFKAMLSNRFVEGQQGFNSAKPGKVDLPDDNGQAMDVLCTIIHHRAGKSDSALSITDMFHVCLAADKYDCIDVIQCLPFLSMLRNAESSLDAVLVQMSCAYLLRAATDFRSLSRHVMLHYCHAQIGVPKICQDTLSGGICGTSSLTLVQLMFH